MRIRMTFQSGWFAPETKNFDIELAISPYSKLHCLNLVTELKITSADMSLSSLKIHWIKLVRKDGEKPIFVDNFWIGRQPLQCKFITLSIIRSLGSSSVFHFSNYSLINNITSISKVLVLIHQYKLETDFKTSRNKYKAIRFY